MTHPLDIPDFLRIPQAERNAAWKGRRLTKMMKDERGSVTLTRHEDAQTRAFRREIEKQKKAKQAERFAMLRERAAEKKRLGR